MEGEYKVTANYIKIAMFTSFPEMAMIILLGFQLTNTRYPPISRILLISIVQALIAFFIMTLNLNAAFRFITQISSMIILVAIILNVKYFKAPVIVLVGAFLQGMIQSITLPILSRVWGIQVNNLTSNFQDAIICFVPVFVISIIIFILSAKKQLYLLDINV